MPIKAAKTGVVKIAGELRLIGDPLRSPLSGRACAIYDVLVEEGFDSESPGHTLVPLERKAIDFLLVDATGAARVRTDCKLQLVILRDKWHWDQSGDEPSPHLEALLQRHNLRRGKSYKEGVFEPGEQIVVVGQAQFEDDPDPSAASGYRDRPRRLVIGPVRGTLYLGTMRSEALSGSSTARA